MNLLLLALAPIFIILVYIYSRDKLEKEPVSLLFRALLFGALTTIPIIFIEGFLSDLNPATNHTTYAFYNAFVVAGFTEEIFKFLALYLLIWNHKEFDDRFDGIVYAVYISLGFAAVENVMYVFNYGPTAGYSRALTAVPAHAIFGVTMGYYFSLAKFHSQKTQSNLFKAFFIPFLLHGTYDFILMVNHPLYLFVFIPFLVYLWISAFRKIKLLMYKQ